MNIKVANVVPVQTAFSVELLDVMDNIEYRRIVLPEDFEAVGHLRQKAFDTYEIYERKFGREVIEEIDFDPMASVFGLYYRGELASTIRVKRVTPQNRASTAMTLFGSVLNSMLDQGMTLIDPSRLAIDAHMSKTIPGLPIVTTRLAIIAALHYNVDFLLFACKQEHMAFYRRVFRATLLDGPYVAEGMKTQSVLLGNSTKVRDDLFQRYPVFEFTETEARLLFDPHPFKGENLCIRPTARIALKAA